MLALGVPATLVRIGKLALELLMMCTSDMRVMLPAAFPQGVSFACQNWCRQYEVKLQLV